MTTEKTPRPLLPVFRFRVHFYEVGSSEPHSLGQGHFSEVSGLEVTMEHKTVKAGGHNNSLRQLPGRVSFATVILKRGFAAGQDLWRWFNHLTTGAYAHRFDIKITVLDMGADPKEDAGALTWTLAKAMPVKFKAAELNAKTSEIGIEELHLVHEGLTLTVS